MSGFDDIQTLAATYRQRGVLIDTNLLLVLILGRVDPQRIPDFKRTNNFTADDFELLEMFIKQFYRIITTPFILTEINSFLNQTSGKLRDNCYAMFAKQLYSAEILPPIEEIYAPSVEIVRLPEYFFFGLTDAGIVYLNTPPKYLILTNDLRLAVHLATKGIDTVNFNHLRQYFWDS